MSYKKFLFIASFCLAIVSCSIFKSITSNTSIAPNKSFVLGDNEHGKFKAKVKNVSNQPIEIKTKPLGGVATLVKTLQPNESITIKIEANTAVIIKNNSNDTASIDLKVNSDTGLSMGFSKQLINQR